MLDNLLKKKQYYLNLQATIKEDDGRETIEKLVEDYRKTLIENFEIDKQKKLEKVDAYLEVINELIDEAEKENDTNSEEPKISDEEIGKEEI